MNLREHDDAEIVRRRQDVVAFLQFADNHRSMFAHRPASDGSAYISYAHNLVVNAWDDFYELAEELHRRGVVQATAEEQAAELSLVGDVH